MLFASKKRLAWVIYYDGARLPFQLRILSWGWTYKRSTFSFCWKCPFWNRCFFPSTWFSQKLLYPFYRWCFYLGCWQSPSDLRGASWATEKVGVPLVLWRTCPYAGYASGDDPESGGSWITANPTGNRGRYEPSIGCVSKTHWHWRNQAGGYSLSGCWNPADLWKFNSGKCIFLRRNLSKRLSVWKRTLAFGERVSGTGGRYLLASSGYIYDWPPRKI